eukprot:CAMPEP_0117424786 /NCGR_PEP_ID=MMETSP0758-20121206/5152_1 /TAXON_ID=63605 /ORGANISM="Percolomonas cosmopolitus, Strain AE-1 (ATCC 50343)" /LENGTH=272 /DNA_ID=CAMNT_0005208807 /DNA_START=867 /DNA_END=1682 /DNA_ORIENTATION=+
MATITLKQFEENYIHGKNTLKTTAKDPPCFINQHDSVDVDDDFIASYIESYPILDFIFQKDTNVVDESTNHTIRLENEVDADPVDQEKPMIPSFAFYEFPPVPEHVNNAEETAEDEELNLSELKAQFVVDNEKEEEVRKTLWNQEFGNFYRDQLRKRKTREIEREDKNKRDIKRKKMSNESFSEAAARMLRKHVSDGVVKSLNLSAQDPYDSYAALHHEFDSTQPPDVPKDGEINDEHEPEPSTQPKKTYGSLKALVSKSQSSSESNENFLD